MRYRRAPIAGASYFFTVNLADRSAHLLVERIADLREVVRDIWRAHPFKIAESPVGWARFLCPRGTTPNRRRDA